MHKIKVLSEQLINQIAAGEVVERPASVVKELVENAIDAGADKIILELEYDKIRITDTGSGMSKEDAILSLERHATSKIKSLEDLQAVMTMGFRGEALASIASVSKFTLSTRQQESDAGTKLYAEGGVIKEVTSTGMPVGTVIEVADLFYNTPARRKFMKNDTTEYQHIVDIIVNTALAYPKISFRLIKDQRPIIDVPATDDEIVRIRSVLGKSISDDMMEVFYGGANLKLRGYLGKPSVARSTRSMQYFFVNGRPIKSHVLSYAVKQSFHSLIPKERHPAFVMFFELEPSLVDVNVHPRKTEVRFKDEREIFRVISAACKKALENNILAPKVNSEQPVNFYQDRRSEGLTQMNFSAAETVVREPVFVAAGETSTETLKENQSASFEEVLSDRIEVIAQFSDAFILCKKGEDLVIIDQHAAHERIRFEALKAEEKGNDYVVQQLLTPVNIELSQADRAVLDGAIEHLASLGIQIEHFGGNTFAIQSVPNFLVKNNIEKVILGIIDDIRNEGLGNDFATRRENVLAYLACRSAVKFGDALSHEEMVALVDKLAEIESKFTCPHGRPSMIVLPKDELWSRFGRKYISPTDDEKYRGINC